MANTISSNLKPIVLGGAQEALSETFAMTARANVDGALQQGQILSGSLGQVLNVAVPAALTAETITVGTTAPSPTDINVSSRQVTLNKLYRSKPFAFTGEESQQYKLIDAFVQQVQEACRAISYQINADMCALYLKVPNCVGTAGTGFFASNIQGLADLDKRLTELKIPRDNRDLVISLKDMQALRKLTELTYVNYAGTDETKRMGTIPVLSGFGIYDDQQIPTHTTGTITGTPDVGSAGAAYKATSIPIDCGSGEAVALKAGDIVTFSENTAYQYVVAADLTITAGNSGTLTIQHGLYAAVTSSSALALATGHGTSLVNIAGQLKGFTVVNRMPARSVFGTTPLGDAMPIIEPKTGMGLMLVAYPGYHQVIWEVVGLYGMDVTDERRLVRVYTYAS